jgi:DNA-binding MarR family transcriptional regulator
MIDNMLSIIGSEPVTKPPAISPDAFALLVADVFDAAGVLRRYGERTAASAGQTQARWQLLSVASDGDWTVPMVADRLGTSRQAVQRIANELVADALAAFEDNPRHRRSPFLRLTAEGRRVLGDISTEALRRDRLLLEKTGTLDLGAVRTALRQVTAAVRAEIADDEPISD